jgi:hypothetical protein
MRIMHQFPDEENCFAVSFRRCNSPQFAVALPFPEKAEQSTVISTSTLLI